MSSSRESRDPARPLPHGRADELGWEFVFRITGDARLAVPSSRPTQRGKQWVSYQRVDADRPVAHHGIPPRQLNCEFAALGMEPVKTKVLTGGDAYLTAFRLSGPRPAPEKIVPCAAASGSAAS